VWLTPKDAYRWPAAALAFTVSSYARHFTVGPMGGTRGGVAMPCSRPLSWRTRLHVYRSTPLD
jgi:hypothetical protein